MINNWIKTILFTIAFLGLSLKTAPQVKAQIPDHFDVNIESSSNKTAGVPFRISVIAKNSSDDIETTYVDTASLSDSSGSIYPLVTGSFSSGEWEGDVYITEAVVGTKINAVDGSIVGESSTFNIYADSRFRYIAIDGGNNQLAQVYDTLSQALSIKVVDPYNNPLSGVGVNFAISSYPPGATGQSITTLSGSTDSSGNISTSLTLGKKTGTYVTTASLGTGIYSYVTFYSNAIAGALHSIHISPYTGVIPLGGYISFAASGYDQYQNDVLISPTWSVQNGGGSIDQAGLFHATTQSGSYLNTVRTTDLGIGATASVTVITSGESWGDGGSDATFSAIPVASPTPAPTSLAAGVLNDVYVDPAVITALQDAEIPIFAQAVDSLGNTISQGVNFTFEVSGDLGTITQTGTNSVLLTASEGGIGTITVTAQQGNVVKIAKIVGSVGTGLNRRLIIELVESPQRVDEPFTLSIAAKDSLNNFVTNYSGPIVIADTTGTISPEVVESNENGIWYVQAIIQASSSEVSITVAGDGMVGVSNIFEVTGDPNEDELFGVSGAGSGGLGEILGSSISAKLKELFQAKDLTNYTIARYIGAGLAGGIGILGASIGGGLMASKGLEAIGRNPYAKRKLKVNLYLSIIAFLGAAALAVYAAFLIIR